MYKIYYKQSLFVLGDDAKLGAQYALKHKYVNKAKLHRYISDKLRSNTFFVSFIYHSNVEELLQAFQSHFHVRIAAGGLVENDKKNKLLVIYKRGIWDLPKGHLEKGETIELCAIREVSEECQLRTNDLKIVNSLCETRHIYALRGKFQIKHTYWYLMEYLGEQKPKPLRNEGIKAAFWFKYKKIDYLFHNAHASIVEVINRKLRGL